jgi:hypothetical protein
VLLCSWSIISALQHCQVKKHTLILKGVCAYMFGNSSNHIAHSICLIRVQSQSLVLSKRCTRSMLNASECTHSSSPSLAWDHVLPDLHCQESAARRHPRHPRLSSGIWADYSQPDQNHGWHGVPLPGYAEASSYTIPASLYTSGGIPPLSDFETQFVSGAQTYVPYSGH